MSDNHEQSFFRSLRFRYGLGLLIFLSAAGYFLWAEHKAHILSYAPAILILGGCLAMHFFMHHGHSGHGDHGGASGDEPGQNDGGTP